MGRHTYPGEDGYTGKTRSVRGAYHLRAVEGSGDAPRSPMSAADALTRCQRCREADGTHSVDGSGRYCEPCADIIAAEIGRKRDERDAKAEADYAAWETPPVPGGLCAEWSEGARQLWHDLSYDLDVIGRRSDADLLALAQAVRGLDRLEGIAATLQAEGLSVEGSKGQRRPHPLLKVESALRTEVTRSLDALGFAQRRAVSEVTGRLEREGRGLRTRARLS